MVKTKRTAMVLALGLLLMLFTTAFAAAPAQASISRTASAPATSQQVQAGWSGWSQVPGNGSTLSGPATTYNEKNYVFVRGTNNHLYVNRMFGGMMWSGWREVPGNGLTLSAPAATTLAFNQGNTLHLFVRGTDNKIYTNTFENGTVWSGWSEVPGHGLTPDAPGAIAFATSEFGEGQVNLYVRGTNDRIYENILRVTR